MKVLKKYNQFRRDCWCDLECENCGINERDENAYDDDNFWENVIPNLKCRKCGKSTASMKLEPVKVKTKYNSSQVI